MIKKQCLFLFNFCKLIEFCIGKGYEVTAGELYRTQEQHDYNLKHGKSKAKRSKHQDRLAGDLNLFKAGIFLTKTEDYLEAGKYWESLNTENVWGGSFQGFPDGNHFQMGK